MIGIILAAGFSKRMGMDKLELEIKGRRLIEIVIEEALKSNFSEVYIVCRSGNIADIARQYPLNVVINDLAKGGQSTSIVTALEVIGDAGKGYMFLLGDQPFINKLFIDDMIDYYNESKSSILIPNYKGERGSPVIFSSYWRSELLSLRGDEGGRQVVKKNQEYVTEYNIDIDYIGKDIDTILDYEDVLKLL